MRSLLLILTFISMSTFANDEVLVRLKVDRESPWVGQRVILSLDVLARDGWASLDGGYRPEVAGAYVLPSDTQSTRLNETIGGHTYSGQRYDLSVFAQSKGIIQVSEASILVKVRTFGGNEKESVVKKEAPAISFQASLPPGVDDPSLLVTSPEFDVDETWSELREPVRAGDAIERRIVGKVENASGMAIPPVSRVRVPGVRTYIAEPGVDDRRDRGQLSGRRTDLITYVFEAPGTVRLPEIRYVWWNPDSQSLKTLVLEGREIVVLAHPAGHHEGDSAGAVASLWWIAVFVSIGVGVFGARRRIRSWYAEIAATRRTREPYLFRQVKRIAAHGNALETLSATFRWLEALDGQRGASRLDVFLDRWGGESSAEVVAWLNSGAASRPDGRVPEAFVSVLHGARARCIQEEKTVRLAAKVLPELNEPC